MTKQDFFQKDGTYAETKRLLLRSVEEWDKTDFMNLKIDVSSIPKAYELPEYYDSVWEDALHGEDVTIFAIEKKSGDYVGMVNIRNLENAVPEIGIDVVKSFRNRGYGFEMVKALTEQAKRRTGIDAFLVCIYSDNQASEALFKKFKIEKVDTVESEFISAMKMLHKYTLDDCEDGLKDRYLRELNRNINRYHLKV